MALWQFDLLLAPRESVIPLVVDRDHLPESVRDSGVLWAGWRLPDGFEERLEAILPWSPSSDTEWKMFGEEEGTRADILSDQHGVVEEIRLRLDARTVDPDLLNRLTVFADAEDCVLVLVSGRVIEPDSTAVWIELELSSAMQFIRDPRAFFDRLQQRRLAGQ